jgi:energy-coupling factor transporter ATP-binding protein EcfA2
VPFSFSIPRQNGQTQIDVEPGTSVVFVGANGGGKTRLAAHIEAVLNLNAHRISAHRALTLNPSVAKISERAALSALRTGVSQDEL